MPTNRTRTIPPPGSPVPHQFLDLLGLKPASVLLAEDDAEIRPLLAKALREGGYEVIESADGRRLLQIIEAAEIYENRDLLPDLIVTDVRLPGCSGLKALEALRRFRGWIPAILITAFGDASTRDEAARCGAAAFLDKPFDVDALLSLARRLVPPVRDRLEG